jgi:hypothetical protein
MIKVPLKRRHPRKKGRPPERAGFDKPYFMGVFRPFATQFPHFLPPGRSCRGREVSIDPRQSSHRLGRYRSGSLRRQPAMLHAPAPLMNSLSFAGPSCSVHIGPAGKEASIELTGSQRGCSNNRRALKEGAAGSRSYARPGCRAIPSSRGQKRRRRVAAVSQVRARNTSSSPARPPPVRALRSSRVPSPLTLPPESSTNRPQSRSASLS